MGSRPPLSQHAQQDCVSVSGSALRWSGGHSRHPWQHSRTRSWLSCCCPVVGCPDRPPGSARPPCWQEAGCSPGHPWKHSRTCPWIPCCCSVVGRPDRPPGSACPPHWQEAGFWCCHPWKHPRTCPWISCCCSVVGRPDCPPGSACPPRWKEGSSPVPRWCLRRYLPQLPLLQPRPRGAPRLRQHCRLPCRCQCCCLPRIPLLLNTKAFTLCNSSRWEKDFTQN